jgi:hypothetical protein
MFPNFISLICRTSRKTLSLTECGFSCSNAKAINVLITSKISSSTLKNRRFLCIPGKTAAKPQQKNYMLQNYGDSSDINVTKQLRDSSRKSPFTESNHPYHIIK